MKPIKIFFCCTNTLEDKKLRGQLETHLMLLKRLSKITLCLTREILAGTNYCQERDERLHNADLILLLVSPDFIASDYHYGTEMHHALEKHHAGNVWVTPIMLRPTGPLEETPLGKLQALPRNGKAITMQRNRDDAFADIVKEISKIVAALLARKYGFIPLANVRKSSDITIICETCKVKNYLNTRICKNCKDLLLTDAEVASFRKDGLICPKCGFENRPDAKCCQQDGQLLSQAPQKLIADNTLQQKNQQQPLKIKRNSLPTPFSAVSLGYFVVAGVVAICGRGAACIRFIWNKCDKQVAICLIVTILGIVIGTLSVWLDSLQYNSSLDTILHVTYGIGVIVFILGFMALSVQLLRCCEW